MDSSNNMGRLRRRNSTTDCSDSTALLKSSPNILENFHYDEFKLASPIAPLSPTASLCTSTNTTKRSKSPKFCETLERHAFMRNVISTKPASSGGIGSSGIASVGKNYARRYSTPSEKEATVRKSLEEISKDIKEIEHFLNVTENVLRAEKEEERRMSCTTTLMNGKSLKRKRTFQAHSNGSPNKENKTPSPIKSQVAKVTYKINAFKAPRRHKPNSPRYYYSRLYFRNGRIGCVEAEKQQVNNIESTHELVKHILRYEHEKPLCDPESVKRVLSGAAGVDEKHNMDEMMLQTREQSTSTRSIELLNNTLPGAVPEAKPEQIILQQHTSPSETYDSCSQPVYDDEDEQDVQICYDELPEVQNDEENLGRHSTTTSINDILDSEILAVTNAATGGVNDEDEVPINMSINRLSSAGSLDSEGQQFLRDQVRHLVRRFTARANKMKSRLEMPPTPSSSASSPSPPPPPPVISKKQLMPDLNGNRGTAKNQKIKLVPARTNKQMNGGALFEADTPRSNVWLCSTLCGSNNDEKTLDPQGKIYIFWLCIVSLSFLYNAWVIPLRSAFPFQTKENTNIWLICDFCADIIYLLDVVFFKHRIMYLFEGFWVKNKTLTRKNYMRKLQFKLDLLALLPLELLYFKYGTGAVYLRFPRLFKIQSFWEVFRLLDRVISSPHIVRVAKTLTYMLYMIHITATLYYAYSTYKGLATNRWVFNGKGHPYVRCFAFATKTATSIGKNPKPSTEGEYVFMTVAWLMGVFVFALLIGQIRDIISTATRNKNEYRQLEDETLEYMRRLNLPQEVQKRVKMWFKFTWDQQRTLDESNILDSLPINLKTDIAISVHIQTLSKVQLFADCEEALLRDLVLKLRAVTFLPGDFVCRKGEVGREMYIVKLGQVQVMGGPHSDVVLATLTEGSVFGEISLLGINGADRRTADVRSKGYSNLFVLSKSDLNEVIAYYPNAQAILKKRARQLMRKNAAREREEAREARARSAIKADVVIGNPKTPETAPKLLQTVIQALPYESPAVMLITRGSKRMRKNKRAAHMETILDDNQGEVGCVGGGGEDAIVYAANNTRDSFLISKRTDGRCSPDLLSSIQNELKSKHKFINLTDSEKALIITNSNNNSMDCISEHENDR